MDDCHLLVPEECLRNAHAERPVCPVLHHADAISVKTLMSEVKL